VRQGDIRHAGRNLQSMNGRETDKKRTRGRWTLSLTLLNRPIDVRDLPPALYRD
jgi:hypothetical protein